MAKWISEAQTTELAGDSNDSDEEPMVNDRTACVPKWKPTTLAVLFGGKKQLASWLTLVEIDAESTLMQALAEAEEDLWPDDGEVEIPSDDKYNGWCCLSPNTIFVAKAGRVPKIFA